jgi:hypothetical protein
MFCMRARISQGSKKVRRMGDDVKGVSLCGFASLFGLRRYPSLERRPNHGIADSTIESTSKGSLLFSQGVLRFTIRGSRWLGR